MRSVSVGFFLSVALALAATAQGQEKQPQPQPKPEASKEKPANTNRAEQLQKLLKEYEGPAEKVQEEIDEAATKLLEAKARQAELAEGQIKAVMALVNADPKDDVALEAIDHLLHDQLEYLDKEQATAIFESLTQHHAASDKIAPLCQFTAELELSDGLKAFLSAVVAKNKNAEARSWAQFALASAQYTEADAANDPKLFKEAERLFEKVVKEIPADATEGTAVDVAQRYLFELRHLMPGHKAPDFESEDLKGKPVKLSQQRGKVTLLVFWATWCEFCAELQPQQLALQKKYAGRPFSIVAISGDDDPSTVKQHLAEHPLPWTHWFNGPEGGVLDAWNVQAFPTVYLIDAAGVIRYRNIRDQELDKAVETLVKEAEASAAAAAKKSDKAEK